MTMHVDDDEVRRLLHLEPLLGAVRRALIDLSAGRVVQPLRTVMEFEQGLLFLKPVVTGEVLATKLITHIPGNAARGLPTLLATIVLMDASTGRTLAVMDATWLTALRTAAVSAVAVDCLTSRHAKTVAMLGSGALARTHALAARCADEVNGVQKTSAEEAVRGADIVCTVTNATEPVLKGAWLKPGAFVAAIGAPRPSWRELDDEAMANIVIADSYAAAVQESGDVILSGASHHLQGAWSGGGGRGGRTARLRGKNSNVLARQSSCRDIDAARRRAVARPLQLHANFARREKDLLICAGMTEGVGNMNQQNLLAKLNQIVEQAQLTLQDPRSLIAERQKMIIALARFVCTEMSNPSATPPEA